MLLLCYPACKSKQNHWINQINTYLYLVRLWEMCTFVPGLWKKWSPMNAVIAWGLVDKLNFYIGDCSGSFLLSFIPTRVYWLILFFRRTGSDARSLFCFVKNTILMQKNTIEIWKFCKICVILCPNNRFALTDCSDSK